MPPAALVATVATHLVFNWERPYTELLHGSDGAREASAALSLMLGLGAVGGGAHLGRQLYGTGPRAPEWLGYAITGAQDGAVIAPFGAMAGIVWGSIVSAFVCSPGAESTSCNVAPRAVLALLCGPLLGLCYARYIFLDALRCAERYRQV